MTGIASASRAMNGAAEYRRELERAADELRGRGARVAVRGDGPARFLFAERGERGAELYGGADGAYVDPADGDRLLGEVRFDSTAEAVEAVWRWLTDALPPAASAGGEGDRATTPR